MTQLKGKRKLQSSAQKISKVQAELNSETPIVDVGSVPKFKTYLTNVIPEQKEAVSDSSSSVRSASSTTSESALKAINVELFKIKKALKAQPDFHYID